MAVLEASLCSQSSPSLMATCDSTKYETMHTLYYHDYVHIEGQHLLLESLLLQFFLLANPSP